MMTIARQIRRKVIENVVVESESVNYIEHIETAELQCGMLFVETYNVLHAVQQYKKIPYDTILKIRVDDVKWGHVPCNCLGITW